MTAEQQAGIVQYLDALEASYKAKARLAAAKLVILKYMDGQYVVRYAGRNRLVTITDHEVIKDRGVVEVMVTNASCMDPEEDRLLNESRRSGGLT